MPIKIKQFSSIVDSLENYLVIDVRSEGEFEHAHIPNAFSMPIFNNEERKIIGTAYKQQSKEIAIKLGLDFYGPKLKYFINHTEELLKEVGNKPILVHCWRGGMRSNAMAWLLNFYGFDVYLLEGGYKTYRSWALEQFTLSYPIKIVGGCTGAAKTEIIQEMQKNNIPAIDLEKLASHKGSAFGYLGMNKQPTQEQFENILAFEFYKNMKSHPSSIFIEDESQRIGNVHLPNDLWNTIREKNILFLEIPFQERLIHIVEEYGVYDKNELKECIVRITKSLGGLNAKNCLQYIDENDFENCFSILLNHYDKSYKKGIEKRDNWEKLLHTIHVEDTNPENNLNKILNEVEKL